MNKPLQPLITHLETTSIFHFPTLLQPIFESYCHCYLNLVNNPVQQDCQIYCMWIINTDTHLYFFNIKPTLFLGIKLLTTNSFISLVSFTFFNSTNNSFHLLQIYHFLERYWSPVLIFCENYWDLNW